MAKKSKIVREKKLEKLIAKYSKTREDLPEPLTPVTPINFPRGNFTERFFKLFSRAHFIKIQLFSNPTSFFVFEAMCQNTY